MVNKLKLVVRNLLPPVLYRGVKSVSLFIKDKKHLHKEEKWGLRGVEWYNNIYDSSDEYRKHYSESIYYFIWTVISDRIAHADTKDILDLGCGPGQFASLLFDKGIKKYCGLDFSSKCIDIAKERCSDFEFHVADISKENVIESYDYNCIVTLEFLEHVENDIQIIERIKSGTIFYGTVPSFPWKSHVRYFPSQEEVCLRYKDYFTSFNVDSFLMNPEGDTFYLIEGIKI